MSKHRFAHGQTCVVIDDETYEGQKVEIAAQLDRRCNAHNALCYGCIMSGDHIAICEEQLAPLSEKQRRALN